MKSRSRLGTSLSTIAVAAFLSGCAVGHQSRESVFGHAVDHENIGLATKALAELNANNFPAAVDLAERAVENSPSDAGFRSLLANCYFAVGRFASAEQAYRDSLSLAPNQPNLVLKLALVQIAQGKNAEALAALDVARPALEPADYGLAVALAGRPDAAVEVLGDAARANDADARVRQNLALAYGLSGDWTMARTVAAQDVSPDQLDSRIQQWMAMASPVHSSDQVAALLGIQPSADPGQPQRLALRSAPAGQALAEAIAPKPEVVEPQAQPVVAAEADIPAVAPVAAPEPMPQSYVAPAPRLVKSAEAAPVVPQIDIPAAAVAEATRLLVDAPPAPPAPVVEAEAAPAVPVDVPVVQAAAPKPVSDIQAKFGAKADLASYVTISDEVRRAAAKARPADGRSTSVVQLGAYSSPERVSIAWQTLTKRYPALASYKPMRARFDGPNGTVWRLSIKGFASRGEAVDRCELLQSRGGNCFVRQVAGDAPVQFASR